MVPRRTFWMIAFVFSAAAVGGLLRDIGPMPISDSCQAACPCDTVSPLFEQVPGAVSPVGDGTEMDAAGRFIIVNEKGLADQEPTDPCPLDCPDCRCHMGHVLGAPPEVVFTVVAPTPESLWLETVVDDDEVPRSDLFRPPRGFPPSALN